MLAKIKLHCGTLLGSRCVRQRTLTTLAVALILLPFAAKAQTDSAQSVPALPPGTASSGIVLDTPRSVRVSVSKQKLQIFVAVLGSKLPGVAGYSARACLSSNSAPVTFSGGFVQQLIESRGLPVISWQLAAQTALYARRNSKQYRAATIAAEVGYAATLGMAYLNVGSLALRIAAPVVAHYTERYRDNLNTQLPDPVATYQKYFLSDEDIALQPGKCETRLFLGSYDKTVTSWAVEMPIQ